MKFSLKLQFSKETKGTVVFATQDEDAPITVLYIRKSALNGGAPPKSITVNVDSSSKKE